MHIVHGLNKTTNGKAHTRRMISSYINIWFKKNLPVPNGPNYWQRSWAACLSRRKVRLSVLLAKHNSSNILSCIHVDSVWALHWTSFLHAKRKKLMSDVCCYLSVLLLHNHTHINTTHTQLAWSCKIFFQNLARWSIGQKACKITFRSRRGN